LQTADTATIVLETGDRLARAEFEQRYEALPDLKKAELLASCVARTSQDSGSTPRLSCTTT
jgi:hypothetical protein